MLRGASVASLAVLGLLGCASDSSSREQVAAIGLNLAIPKGLVDVDRVRLYVYDSAAVQCAGATITVPPEDVARVFEIALTRCAAKWCGTGSIARDPSKTLTFYVEGRFDAQKGGFTGCVQRAVDQDPLQIDMRAQPLIEGVKCGDLTVGYGETCDPAASAVDEACDGSKCQTLDVLMTKRTAGEGFFRGLPGRKENVSIAFANDKFYGAWSDRAMSGGGGDGPSEITVRRMSPHLVTETAPVVLAGAVRLPSFATGGGTPSSTGFAKRGSVDRAPVMVPLAGGKMLVVFLKDDRVTAVETTATLNVGAADVSVSTGTAQSPHVAANAAGDALIVYVAGGAVKSVLRKASGTLEPEQTLNTGGTPSRPRVASAGTDFIVVWGDGDNIQLRRVGASDGVPKGAQVFVNESQAGGLQDQPDVAAFDTGEAIVTWHDAADGGDIRVQKFDKAGTRTGTEVGQVLNDVIKDGDQDQPVVAAGRTPQGTRFYLVAWRTPNNIAARFVKVDEVGFLVSHAGATTSEFMVSQGDRPRSSPAVAIGTAAAPYCAIAWADDADGDAAGDDDRVRARRFPMPDAPK